MSDWARILKEDYEKNGLTDFNENEEIFYEWNVEYNTSKSVRHPNAEK